MVRARFAASLGHRHSIIAVNFATLTRAVRAQMFPALFTKFQCVVAMNIAITLLASFARMGFAIVADFFVANLT